MNPWLPGKTIIHEVAELAGVVSVLSDPLVAIDGVDGSGKTTLAKRLSATSGWNRVDLDDHLEGDRRPFVEQIRFDALEKAIEPRPIIVSGIHMLEVLNRVGVRPDFLIYVIRMSDTGIPADLDLIERDTNPELSVGQPMPPVLGGIVPGKVTCGLWAYMPRWRPVTAADVVFAVPEG